MKIIVGLGNPGPQYENTRHNAGFKVLDKLAEKYGANFVNESKFKAQTAKVIMGADSVLLAKPQTFMNLSGEAVALIFGYYKAQVEDLLIVFDDLAINLGTLRFRASGSDGGHNGIKSIIKCLGGNNGFARLKVGIGPQPPYMPAEKFVLEKFAKQEETLLTEVVKTAAEAVEFYVSDGIYEAQNKFNGTINP